MEQCNGLTLKGNRCKRIIRKSMNNTINGKMYCSVHYSKLIHNYNNDHDNSIRLKTDIPEHLRTKIPLDILPDIEMFPIEDIEYIFGNKENTLKDILDETTNEYKIPDRLLQIIPPSMLNDVKHLSISELEKIFTEIDPYIIFECKCCYCECFEKDKVSCSKNHDFCKECLSKYVADKFSSTDCKLRCMANIDCEGIFNPNILKDVLDPNLYKNYTEREIQENVKLANIENLFVCPKCSVYSIILDKIYIESMPEPKFVCLNSDCKYVSCIKCKLEFHGNVKCSYAKRDLGTRKVIEEILTKYRTRACPDCSKIFIRTDGCNKMECSCKTKSCYVCKTKITDYSHFHDKSKGQIVDGKCPLYMTENDIEKMSFTNALEEVYQTYKDKPQLIKEVYPILLQLGDDYKEIVNTKFSELKLKVIPTNKMKNTKITDVLGTMPKKKNDNCTII